jgi:hypothetical protein
LMSTWRSSALQTRSLPKTWRPNFMAAAAAVAAAVAAAAVARTATTKLLVAAAAAAVVAVAVQSADGPRLQTSQRFPEAPAPRQAGFSHAVAPTAVTRTALIGATPDRCNGASGNGRRQQQLGVTTTAAAEVIAAATAVVMAMPVLVLAVMLVVVAVVALALVAGAVKFAVITVVLTMGWVVVRQARCKGVQDGASP